MKVGVKKNELSLFYSIFLVLMPILQLYGFIELPFVTFSEYIAVLFIVIMLIKKRILCFDKNFLPVMFYIFLQPLLLFFYTPEETDMVDAMGTAWKLALYIFTLCFLVKNYLNRAYLLKTVRMVAAVSSVYGIAQFVCGTFFNISLSMYLPFLPVIRTELLEQQNGWMALGWIVRARAWFSEPATFAIFLLWAIMMELFIESERKHRWRYSILYAVGIFVSTSSTGCVGLLFIIAAYVVMYPNFLKKKFSKRFILCILVLLPFAIYLLIRLGYIEYFWNHLFANGKGISSQSHFADVKEIFQGKSNLFEILFGHGLQETSGYLPGWIRTYHNLGIVGVTLYIYGFLKLYFQATKNLKIFILVFMGLNIGTEIMLGVYLVQYMSPLFLEKSNDRKG